MAYKIDEIEGIGPSYSEKLQTAGITTTDDLLEFCCTPQGRKQIAEKTGLSEKHLLGWTNMADLMRVSGVGRQFAELLEAAGVDTIKELRNRNAENLAAKIEEVNEAFELDLADPNYDTIAGYVLGRLGRIGEVGDVVVVLGHAGDITLLIGHPPPERRVGDHRLPRGFELLGMLHHLPRPIVTNDLYSLHDVDFAGQAMACLV